MSRGRRILVLALSVGITAAAAACNGSKTDVAARVGSHDITMEQVNTAMKQQFDANGTSGATFTASELAAAQLNILDNMIQVEAMFQRAQKDNLVPDDAKVDQEIEKRKQDAKLSEDDYIKKLQQSGMKESDLREQVKKDLAITALKDKEKARVKAPSDADLEKYYSVHQKEFVAESGVDISTIVTDPANNGAADDAIGDAAAEQKIKAIYEQLKGGADFATVATQRSEDPNTAPRQGRLGPATVAQLKQAFPTRPDLADRLMSMSAGQYTEPIKDAASGRWYIIKVDSKREQTKNLTLKDVRQQIIDAITQQRQQVLLSALLMATMSEISLKNYLADRIVQNPESMAMVKPSELLTAGAPLQQPSPRIENENQNSSGAPGDRTGAARNVNGGRAAAGKQ
ncbi:MAG TPA: SurA N-terminal domain-containing protein [Blastocatellia bacterium]|nr:SurA N-terminal domain-containing protein [Blastocatellia bacterium]